jgi:hypothetical protein
VFVLQVSGSSTPTVDVFTASKKCPEIRRESCWLLVMCCQERKKKWEEEGKTERCGWRFVAGFITDHMSEV